MGGGAMGVVGETATCKQTQSGTGPSFKYQRSALNVCDLTPPPIPNPKPRI